MAAATTSVTVMDKDQASIQQVEIAEQQRVFKVFPNFYSSYDWNAPPMLAKQKYRLVARTLIDPVSFLTTAGIAGADLTRRARDQATRLGAEILSLRAAEEIRIEDPYRVVRLADGVVYALEWAHKKRFGDITAVEFALNKRNPARNLLKSSKSTVPL